MNKFDDSNPSRWVTKIEHYLSLYGNIDNLQKNKWGYYNWMPNVGNGENVIKMLIKATFHGPILCNYFMLILNVTFTILGAYQSYAKLE